MTQCIVIDPAASDVLRASSADPCTGFVALTPVEYASLADVPWHLTPAEGLELGGAILAVWGAAWGIRLLWSAFLTDGEVRE